MEKIHTLDSRPARAVVELDALEPTFEDERIQAAIETLKPTDREALTLVAADGLTHREAALILGIRENTFTVRFQRARQRFRLALSTQGITQHHEASATGGPS